MSTFFIVIPSFRSERFLERTLRSVLDQDLSEHHVHLHVQDALSTDRTVDIIRCFASEVEASTRHRNLTVTHASERDRGMYDAIGKGLRSWIPQGVKPDIFFWLNSDDLLMSDALQKTAQAFADPTVQWIIGEGVDIDKDDHVVHRQPHRRIPPDKLRTGDFNYAGGDWLRAESAAIRFDLVDNADVLDADLRLAGDYDLFVKLSRKADPAYRDFAIRAFRRHDDQLSKAAIAYQHERSRVRYFQAQPTAMSGDGPSVDLAHRTVVFYPDYSGGNAYQPLLYAGVRSHGAKTIQRLGSLADANPHAVVHLHWLNQIVRQEPTRAAQQANELKDLVARAKARGQKVVFTVHNVRSHEGENVEIEEQLTEYLFGAADAVHVHHPVVSLQIQARYKTFPWGRLVVAEHGAYPVGDYLGKTEVLRAFGIDRAIPYVVIPGQIRGYKDIDFQVDVLRRLAAARIVPGRCALLLAGLVHPEVDAEKVAALKSIPGVHVAAQRLDDRSFSSVLHHAEGTLLCYRDISTSGSLFHALSAASPVVAPKLGTIPSYLFEGYNGYLYDPADAASCVSAIRRLLASARMSDMRRHAERSVAHLDWRAALAKILAKVS